MKGIGCLIQCPTCRCASSASMYVDKDGQLRLDHDCPSCGHRGLVGAEILVGCLRDMASASFARDAAHAGLEATADDILAVRDIEPMYRTPAGSWYGLGSKRLLDVAPTPEGECDLFDPRYDHIGDTSWQEGCE